MVVIANIQRGESIPKTDACPSNFGFHLFDHGTAITEIAVRKSTMTGLQNQYDLTVDRGDKQYMISLAENLSPHNFRQYVPILSNNGYLSDEVFETLLENTSAQKPVIATVLIANSPLPSEILDAVNNSTYLSNGHKKQINNYQNGENARVLLEYQISDIKQDIINIEGEIINNAINNDSIPEALTQAIGYFSSKSNAEISDALNVYNLTVMTDDFQAAENILSNLRNMSVNLSTEERDEVTTFCDINDIYLECIGDTMMIDILLSNKDFLFNAARSSSPLYSAMAEILYSYTTDSAFYEYTPIPFEIITPRSINIIDDANDETLSIFEVFPNPTKDVIYVEYDFSQIYDDATKMYLEMLGNEQKENCKFGKILIYTNDAKLLMEIPLENVFGTTQINMKNYVPGQYLLELIDCYGNIQVKKLSKK